MTARGLSLVGVVAAAGVLVGSGLAALAHVPPSDACSDFGALPEGSLSSGSLELWPIGRRCQYYVAGRLARSASFGPSAGELYAWIAGAALVAAIVLLKRDFAAARGVGAVAVLLAACWMAWQYAGVQFAFLPVLLLGVPLAFAIDRMLRSPGTRSIRASLAVAVAISAVAFCAILVVVFDPRVGVAFGLPAGALASLVVTRSRERLAT